MNTLISKTLNNNDELSSTNTLPMFSNWIDDMLNKNFVAERLSNFNTGITLPAVNIKETNDLYVLDMAAPGLEKSNFVVNIDNFKLSISVENENKVDETTDNYTRREYGYASFKRSFTLPKTVNVEAISATYKNGILSIEIPKLEEAKTKPARNIEIS